MKNNFSLTIIFLAVSAFCLQTLTAQTTRETLTNAKIVELVRLGLGETLIVEKIRQSECQCDTSAVALGKLKAAKVPDAVIMAMMNPSSGGYSESQQSNRRPENPGRPIPKSSENDSVSLAPSEKALRQIAEPGIYLFENGKMQLIEPTVYSGSKTSFLGTALTYGIKKTKIRAVIRGKSANTQVTSRRPEFYFVFSREYSNSGAVMTGFGGYSATSPAEFIMISMVVKENSREATLGSIGAFSASTGAADKDIREYSFEKLKPGTYKVVPKIDLATGEYCFYYAGNGGAGSKVFDFSVK